MDDEGIFPYLVDQVAFIDRVDVSIWGRKRKRPQAPIEILRNIPIAAAGRLYGRSLHFRCGLGGNPGELRYGLMRHYPCVPPLRLVLRSVLKPLSAAQVSMAEDSLIRRDFSAYFSGVELTSDISASDLRVIRQRLLPTNRSIREFSDNRGRESLYLGSPKSSWQVRVYQKTDAVVRLELVLRLPFLKSHGIQGLNDLLKLGDIGLWKKLFPPCPFRNSLRRMQRVMVW